MSMQFWQFFTVGIAHHLCRPGRMEVQIEIGLPDERGRVQILNTHSNKMKENSFFSGDVNLEELGMHPILHTNLSLYLSLSKVLLIQQACM
jgi:hypothetical protein